MSQGREASTKECVGQQVTTVTEWSLIPPENLTSRLEHPYPLTSMGTEVFYSLIFISHWFRFSQVSLVFIQVGKMSS